MTLPQNLERHSLQLNPVNSISSGVYSPSSGLPLIKFDISSTEMPTALDLSQLRISGNVTYKSGGAQVTATNAVFRDGFSGDINNCIEHVTVSSKKLNSVLERVTNYSRMIPTIVSGQHGPSDINCQLWNEAGHCVNNFLARNVVVAQEAGRGKSFCAPLYCGIFNSGQDLDISQFGTGGLTIEILLKPNVSGAFGADAAGANPVQYELSDLLLTCPALRASGPEAQAMIKADRVFNFNSITSIFQTLNSSAAVVAVTPGLQNVSSVFMNAINTQDLGNQLRNSARLSNMGQLRELRFSKNGVVSALNGQTLKGREMVDKNYFEALSTNPIGQFGNTMVAYNNFEDGIKNRAQTQNNGGSSLGTCSGAGVLFDAYGNGEDFSNTVFSAEFDNSTLDGTAASTLGLYLFFLNKQSLIMSPEGISVNK